jgi:hypothetical protein
MRLHFLTYGDHNYRISSRRLCLQALRSGWFQSITRLHPRRLSASFAVRYSSILSEHRGGGYWIWKPWIINEALNRINDGEYLLYMDAGCSINIAAYDRLQDYIDMISSSHQNILSMQMHHVERKWTNSNTLRYFGVALDDSIACSGQLMATILMIRRNSAALEMVKQWLHTLHSDPYLFTDRYNSIDPFSDFQDHRHDQSIFSIIRKQNSPAIIPDETWFSDFQGEAAARVPFWGTRLKDSKRMYQKYFFRQF